MNEVIVLIACVATLIWCLGLYGNVRRARIALETLAITAKRQEIIAQASAAGSVAQEAPPKDHTYSVGERVGIGVAMVVVVGLGLVVIFSFVSVR